MNATCTHVHACVRLMVGKVCHARLADFVQDAHLIYQRLAHILLHLIYQRLAHILLPTSYSLLPDKTYVFIAMYRMVGAVLSATRRCALVRVRTAVERGSRPRPLTMLLDAVGTTNAAALLDRSNAIVHILLAMVAHVLLLPLPSQQ